MRISRPCHKSERSRGHFGHGLPAMLVSFVSIGLVVSACGDDTVASTSQSKNIACATDFACPLGWSCDLQRGICQEGIGQDNHLLGVVRCAFGTDEGVEASTDIGASYVSGVIAGQAIEITHAVRCIDAGSGKVLIAASGADRDGVSMSFNLNLPLSDVTAGGSYPVTGYYAAESQVKLHWGYVEKQGQPNVVVAILTGGTLLFDPPNVQVGAQLSVEIDVDVQVPVEAPTDCMATCVSQADCGPGFLADASMTGQICIERWVGGPRHCRLLCDTGMADSDCTALGGACSYDMFCGSIPRCDDSAKAVCDPLPASYPACPDCCNELTGGGGEMLNGRILYPNCACGENAPCKSECQPLCDGSSAINDANNCFDCVFDSPEADQCFNDALDACDADASCAAYRLCLGDCP